MSDLFRSARSVFRRADYHIQELQRASKDLSPGKPYIYSVDYDYDTGKHIHKAVFSEDFSDDLACIMFDAINNLRSCLDQMTYAIACAYTGSEVEVSHFPFAKDVTFWPDKIKGVKNVPPVIAALFETFKPYKGGNNTLWALNYIANTKKHALLIPVGFGLSAVLQRIDGSIAHTFMVPVSVSKNEVVLFTSDSPNFEPEVSFRYTIVISNSEKIIDGKSPVTLLNAISVEVANILDQTEEVCRSIGIA